MNFFAPIALITTTARQVQGLLRLFLRAFRSYLWKIILMTVLSFVSGALEGIGITAIIPLFSILTGTIPTDPISGGIVKLFAFLGLPFTAKYVFILMFALFVGKAAVLFIAQQITVRVNTDFEKKTRERILRYTFGAHWPFLSSQKLGYLDQMLTTDVVNSSSILLYMSNAVFIAVNLLVYSYLVWNTSPVIALLTVLAGGGIFFVFLPLLKKAKMFSESIEGETKKLAHFANEHILGAKTLKAMAVEEKALARGSEFGVRMRKLSLRLSLVQNITSALLSLAGVFFVMGLFAYLYKTSAFEFGSFVVVVFALNRVFSNVQYAQSSAHAISMQVPYLERILRFMEHAEGETEKDEGKQPFSFARKLEFKEVSFAYHHKEPALHTVSFSVAKGETVGLIGPSGAGKTTIVDLLLRLIVPASGVVLCDGNDIQNIRLREWRERIGYVSQEVFLFNDTIENNIRFYRDGITTEGIEQAARTAHIYDFVMSLPEKWQTVVGERGVLLSGGQRQRIMLARVLAQKPELLILDEATSALDNESEQLIQQSIEELKGKITLIIIAHRLSTIAGADRLVALESGRVVEIGTPESLLKEKGSYYSRVYRLV
ncbi:MAG: ABC transporter ATP-binding protein [Candidatus Taylorbacteria bacterium]|nr:ABC transporter ATP-binding protein [Candidatus Taylorbacteria bacterium]